MDKLKGGLLRRCLPPWPHLRPGTPTELQVGKEQVQLLGSHQAPEAVLCSMQGHSRLKLSKGPLSSASSSVSGKLQS